jgi:hypothetical protein
VTAQTGTTLVSTIAGVGAPWLRPGASMALAWSAPSTAVAALVRADLLHHSGLCFRSAAMIVPEFWAEGRASHRADGKQATVRRFGWSDSSQEAAQAMADARAAEALARVLAGENLRRRDPRIAYNGAEGLPIREEIVARHGTAVVTRNSYGARCLNVPDVLFADIDFAPTTSPVFVIAAVVVAFAGSALAAYFHGWTAALGTLFGTAVAAWLVGFVMAQARGRSPDAALARARRRIERFLATRPTWSLRVYRTPAGLRLLAMHRTFDPHDPEVRECFDALGVDKLYARMCANQRCFRARLTAKPWRIGLAEHLKPRPGVWPVGSEHLARRRQWVDTYESRATGFAACAYVETLGRGRVDADADRVRELHDELSNAMRRGVPLA